MKRCHFSEGPDKCLKNMENFSDILPGPEMSMKTSKICALSGYVDETKTFGLKERLPFSPARLLYEDKRVID